MICKIGFQFLPATLLARGHLPIEKDPIFYEEKRRIEGLINSALEVESCGLINSETISSLVSAELTRWAQESRFMIYLCSGCDLAMQFLGAAVIAQGAIITETGHYYVIAKNITCSDITQIESTIRDKYPGLITYYSVMNQH